MTTPVNGPGSNSYTNQWAEVVYTPKTDTVTLPDDTPITTQWADAVTIPGSEGPAAPARNWSDDYQVAMPDPWVDPGPKYPEKPTWSELIQVLEAHFGEAPQYASNRGNKREMLHNNHQSAMDEQFWGPVTSRNLREAYQAVVRGDLEAARRCYHQGAQAASPIMLDLNDDGKLGTTGVTTAKDRIDDQIGRTVSFDIDGDGKKDEIEWMSGDGDGMLVDDRDGGATGAMLTDGEIDGKRLFGDQGGKYANGYEKLKALDKDGGGKVSGTELDGLKVWIDDGDAKLEGGELKTLRELGITEISVIMRLEQNERGEDLMRSTYTQNGQTKVSEDVWFGQK
jgi:hypothetical protein